MSIQFPHSSKRTDRLAKPYAATATAMRPGLVRAVRDAVETGDIPAATYFYRVVAGPLAAQRLLEKNALAELKRWLVQEP